MSHNTVVIDRYDLEHLCAAVLEGAIQNVPAADGSMTRVFCTQCGHSARIPESIEHHAACSVLLAERADALTKNARGCIPHAECVDLGVLIVQYGLDGAHRYLHSRPYIFAQVRVAGTGAIVHIPGRAIISLWEVPADPHVSHMDAAPIGVRSHLKLCPAGDPGGPFDTPDARFVLVIDGMPHTPLAHREIVIGFRDSAPIVALDPHTLYPAGDSHER